MNVLRWLAMNKYRHIEEHADEILDGTRDGTLKREILKRAEYAVRLNWVRAALLAVIILPAYVTLIVGLLETVGIPFGEGVVETLGSFALAAGGLAAIGLWVANRSLGILEADIYLMTMQEIAEQGVGAPPREFLPDEREAPVAAGGSD